MEVGLLPKVVFIIQARLKSTRLPGKVLLPMPMGGDITVINYIINQLYNSKYLNKIYVATSNNKENEEIIKSISEKSNVYIFRGSEDNVLSRFLSILKVEDCDIFVRLTADNPIIDINILDNLIEMNWSSKSDYTASINLPIGMNFEVVKSRAFLKLSNMELTKQEKEHVTLKIKNDSNFICRYINFEFLNISNIRVTVDYPLDYLVVSFIVQIAIKFKLNIGVELISFVDKQYPWLFNLNVKNIQKNKHSNLRQELKEIIPILNDLDFNKSAEILTDKLKNEL